MSPPPLLMNLSDFFSQSVAGTSNQVQLQCPVKDRDHTKQKYLEITGNLKSPKKIILKRQNAPESIP